MKQKITVTDYAQRITEALPQGVLLNTNGDKHNAMVIGWGGLGGVFTVSIPLDKADPVITKICGWQSGHNIDKVKETGLTLEEPQANRVSGIKEYPLTLECKVLYSQCQDPTQLPESIYKKSYPQDVDGSYPMANRDPHTAYIGEIVAAYIIH